MGVDLALREWASSIRVELLGGALDLSPHLDELSRGQLAASTGKAQERHFPPPSLPRQRQGSSLLPLDLQSGRCSVSLIRVKLESGRACTDRRSALVELGRCRRR